MTEEFSAGGIIFKNDGRDQKILLIKNSALRNPKKAYWGFPKGHLEKDETAEQAALREVKEETGLETAIIEKIDDVHYFFTHPEKGTISKQVTIFLMKYLNGEAKAQEKELLDLGWFSPEEAIEMLSFKADKVLLKAALAIMNP